MALRLDLGEEHALEQIGHAVGRARSRIIERMRVAREHGVQELLGRLQGRGRAPRVSEPHSRTCVMDCAGVAGSARRMQANGKNNATA